MPIPGPHFCREGVLQRVVEEGGFVGENVTVTVTDKVLVVDGDEEIAGLTAFMSGPMMAKAREGYTEEEARWGESVGHSVRKGVEKFGGIRFEAYVLLATK